MTPRLPYLNLGCGDHYRSDWINMDVAPVSADVLRCDLRRPLPLADASCEVVYHCAVLEHLRRSEALPFMRECWRVLRPGGVIRVGTPDFEAMCRLYLARLAACSEGDGSAEADCEWMRLELCDQAVREASGGEMLGYLRQQPLPNEAFVLQRIGAYGRDLLRAIRAQAASGLSPASPAPRRARLRLDLRAWLLQRLVGKAGVRALQVGTFRDGGEVHFWCYDRLSLRRLLEQAGFADAVVQPAHASRIANWSAFELDTLPDGTERKPDCFFMEAVKKPTTMGEAIP
jgi:SAM-dependent methyltransferase